MAEKIFILGARRGLGREILQLWHQQRPQDLLWASSRREFALEKITPLLCDLTNADHIKNLLQIFDKEKPTRVFYIAGGGPYGRYADKDLKDHQWSFQLNFLTPAQLLYEFLKADFTTQFIAVGSNIAEIEADPMAASYAAGKHALKGLLSTIKDETNKDIRLFSPGYMDTGMLPANAAPRMNLAVILPAKKAATEFVTWALNPQASWHLECRP
jgi:short-subunit dehydrogenase